MKALAPGIFAGKKNIGENKIDENLQANLCTWESSIYIIISLNYIMSNVYLKKGNIPNAHLKLRGTWQLDLVNPAIASGHHFRHGKPDTVSTLWGFQP
jgi:hypothetical protein